MKILMILSFLFMAACSSTPKYLMESGHGLTELQVVEERDDTVFLRQMSSHSTSCSHESHYERSYFNEDDIYDMVEIEEEGSHQHCSKCRH